VSRERARRREERLATAARRLADAQVTAGRRADARRRRQRRTDAVRTVMPRRARRWSRRTRAQRATVVLALVGVALLTYLLVDSWSVRVAVVLAALIATPAVVTIALGRSTR